MTTTLLLPPPRPNDIVDELTRRRFLGGLGALTLLGACAEDDLPSGLSATPTPLSGVRISHDGGEIELPQAPSRIVALGQGSAELVVALGLKPVGIGTAHVDLKKGDAVFEDYYLSEDQIGRPRYVGPGPFNHEAITALGPDLMIIDSETEDHSLLAEIAPIAFYDIYQGGSTWQDALRRLGAALDRETQAAAAIATYEGAVAAGRGSLAEILRSEPRVSMIYLDRPNYGNVVYGPGFPSTRPLLDLGFALVGVEKAAEVSDGRHGKMYGKLSTELLGELETDVILSMGPVDWPDTAAAPILSAGDIPIVSVRSSYQEPAGGPITSPKRVKQFVEALQEAHG